MMQCTPENGSLFPQFFNLVPFLLSLFPSDFALTQLAHESVDFYSDPFDDFTTV